MEISARNVLQGIVLRVVQGAINTEVVVALPGGSEVVSIITKQSAERLGLKVGKPVYAIIKSSDVMIATD